MAIKPKSRAHEDRIKALEARPYVGVGIMDRVYASWREHEVKMRNIDRSITWLIVGQLISGFALLAVMLWK